LNGGVIPGNIEYIFMGLYVVTKTLQFGCFEGFGIFANMLSLQS